MKYSICEMCGNKKPINSSNTCRHCYNNSRQNVDPAMVRNFLIHDKMTMQEIGNFFNVSRQRIDQICKEHNIHRNNRCIKCGVSIMPKINFKLCRACATTCECGNRKSHSGAACKHCLDKSRKEKLLPKEIIESTLLSSKSHEETRNKLSINRGMLNYYIKIYQLQCVVPCPICGKQKFDGTRNFSMCNDCRVEKYRAKENCCPICGKKRYVLGNKFYDTPKACKNCAHSVDTQKHSAMKSK